MTVETDSGTETINKRTRYGKFALGYLSTGAFSGAQTLRQAWEKAQQVMHAGAYQLGVAFGLWRKTYGRF